MPPPGSRPCTALSPWLGLLFALALDRRRRRSAIGVLTLRLGGHFLPLSHDRLGPLDRAAVRQRRCARPPHRPRRTSRRCSIGRLVAGRPARDLLPDLGAGRRWPSLFSHNLLAVAAGPRDPQPARRRDAARERRRRRVPRAPRRCSCMAALLAGLAGWLYAHMNRFVSPSPFDVRASIEYLLMAVGRRPRPARAARSSARRSCWC